MKKIASAGLLGLSILLAACGGGGGGGAVNPTPAAPAITGQPTNQSVVGGGNVTFSVTASGTPAPTFQWERSVDATGTYHVVRGGAWSTDVNDCRSGARDSDCHLCHLPGSIGFRLVLAP